MSLDITPETAVRLIARAQEHGLSVDALLRSLLHIAPPPQTTEVTEDLPTWDLGAIGALCRTDIYEDAR